MRILLTGGTGFIGQALLPALLSAGHDLLLLSRRRGEDKPGLKYLLSLDEIDSRAPVEAVINLAGASLAARRWSRAYKAEIIGSRIDTTRRLLALFARLRRPPATLLSASEIGYYGHHGDELLAENGGVTPGFAQSLCADWEALARQAGNYGVRSCQLRLGVVLDRGGGAFEQMARSFRFGIGTWIGSGQQWLSWIHREDVVAATLFLLGASDFSGPVNLTSPNPVTHREFCRALATQCHTLTSIPVPAAAMRLVLGEMAEELLINGQRVVPGRLQAAGFGFAYPRLEDALNAICRG